MTGRHIHVVHTQMSDVNGASCPYKTANCELNHFLFRFQMRRYLCGRSIEAFQITPLRTKKKENANEMTSALDHVQMQTAVRQRCTGATGGRFQSVERLHGKTENAFQLGFRRRPSMRRRKSIKENKSFAAQRNVSV